MSNVDNEMARLTAIRDYCIDQIEREQRNVSFQASWEHFYC